MNRKKVLLAILLNALWLELDYPGVIVPINMHACPSGRIVTMRDSFLCATVGLGEVTTDVGAGFNPASSVAGFCCSGVDFIVQVSKSVKQGGAFLKC